MEDSKRFPGFGEPLSTARENNTAQSINQREGCAWKYSDTIYCASSFTLRSLIEAGANERICRVIPYGVDLASFEESQQIDDYFHAIFVGSGGQRKGLHHLLLAWSRAVLPKTSQLTLVCRSIDAEIEKCAAATPRVNLIRGLSAERLNALYARSSLMVMPSLVEGFGQVYLEALAQGCPVLGTANTCLPDIGGEADGIFMVDPGNLDQLISQLEQRSRDLPGNPALRRKAMERARMFTWPAFRQALGSSLNSSA